MGAGPTKLRCPPLRDAPGDPVGESHPNTGKDRGVFALDHGMCADRCLVTEAGILGVTAIGVGIVGRREHRIDGTGTTAVLEERVEDVVEDAAEHPTA